MALRLLICGDRNWKDKQAIWRVVATLHSKPDLIITGANLNKGKVTYKGADGYAYQIAIEMGIPYIICNADWDKYGNKAGPIRNQAMLEERPDYALAFHDNLSYSKGTKDMVERLKKTGVTTELHGSKGSVTYLVPEGTATKPNQTTLI